MATIIAEFSNGHRDEYKGTRQVQAAWMITCNETGKVLLSGHSLDRARAQKTAEANVALVVKIPGRHPLNVPRSAMNINPAWAKTLRGHLADCGVDAGTNTHALLRAAKAWNAELNAAKRARVSIEIVDL